MFGLLNAISYLNSQQSYHGDICPQFIYLDFWGTYKIYDSAYFIPFHNGYYRALTEQTYLAPEVLANVHEERPYPFYDRYTSDIFSVGLVLLQAMTLIDPRKAYNSNFIDSYYLNSMLRLASKNYPQMMINAVSQCLLTNNRPKASQLLQKYTQLQQYLQPQKLSLRQKKQH